MSGQGIVDIIDFDESFHHNQFDNLKNDREMILKEIENQEDKHSFTELCDIERLCIQQISKTKNNFPDLITYFTEVTQFYSKKVAILMEEIFVRAHDSSISSLQDELEQKERLIEKQFELIQSNQVVEQRLKVLEIENAQLRKIKSRAEENESKMLQYQKKMEILEGMVNSNKSVLIDLDYDDIVLYEKRFSKAKEMLREKKDEIYNELVTQEHPQPMCIICSKKAANIMLKPCNHLCLCPSCAMTISKCPFDNKFITKREKVFLP